MSFSQIPPELLPYLIGEKEDNSSLQASILRISVTFAALATVSTALRLWVRFHILHVGLDDVFMILAFIFAMFLTASCLIARQFGMGKHLWNLSENIYELPEHTARVTKAMYACYLSYAFAIAFVKFSIIATYLRVFPNGWLRRTLLGIGFVVLASCICNIFAIIFTCIPVEAAWKYELKGKCFPIAKFFYASSAINIATDLALCFLPIPKVWELVMTRSQKVVLCILFSLGTFTCIASIFRLSTLHLTAGPRSTDFTYNIVPTLNWCIIEVGTAVTCTSLSAIRPLLTKFFPKMFAHATTNPASSSKNSMGGPKPSSAPLKLTRLSHTQSRSCSIPWKDGDTERGEIMVKQTFDMSEEYEIIKDEKGRTVWGHGNGEREKDGITIAGRASVGENESQEELVVERKQSFAGSGKR